MRGNGAFLVNKYVLSAESEQDIIDIYLYSIEHFGLSRADEYIADLYERFSAIAADPEIGKSCDDVVQGLRRMRCTSHVIYYRLRTRDVFVLRLLHARMDPGRHL